MKSKIDRRTLYTRMVIRNSLFELLKEKHLSDITVSELCELSEINRATFYRNYMDIYDLYEQLEKELIQKSFSNGNIQQDRYTLLELIYENQDFYREFFYSRLESTYINQTLNEMYLKIEAFAKMQDNHDETVFPISFQYNYYGLIGVIGNWIKDGCIQSPKAFGDIIFSIIEKQYKNLPSTIR